MRRRGFKTLGWTTLALTVATGCAESAIPIQSGALMVHRPGLVLPGAFQESWSGDESDRRDGILGVWAADRGPSFAVAEVRSFERTRTNSNGSVSDSSFARTRSIQVFR